MNFVGYVITIAIATAIAVLAILLWFGKGSRLVAGFHTDNQRDGYNAKRVNRFLSIVLILVAICVAFMSVEAYSLTFALIIAFVAILAIILINTLKFFRE